MNNATAVKIHPSAEVSPEAQIGPGTSIWNNSQVRAHAIIGSNCILAKDVYVDAGVTIGSNVKIQNGVSLFHGVVLEDGVFCGPHCTFTNDKLPRAINPDGSLKSATDWKVSNTLVKRGASIGAHATIVCGVEIGAWAMIGAGAVVTKNVPNFGLVLGNPARLQGFVCFCGERLPEPTGQPARGAAIQCRCTKCQQQIEIPFNDVPSKVSQ